MTRARAACKRITWPLAFGAVLGALHLSGRAGTAAPALTAPSAWPGWMAEQQPEAVVAGVLRLMALAACWYLFAVTVIGIGARLIGSRPLMRAADALTLPAVRELVGWTVGVGMVVSTMVRESPAIAANSPPPTIVMTRLPAATAPSVVVLPTPTTAPLGPVAATWVVRPGNSFWSIARDVTARELRREPSEPEITAYWRALIEANRGALADPDNVDLIFAGQVFRVPPLPGR